MPKRIYIIRHGETDFNRRGIMQGSSIDTDLSEVGRLQSQAFFEQYRHLAFDAIVTSSLKRTWQTVAPFLEQISSAEQVTSVVSSPNGVASILPAAPLAMPEIDKAVKIGRDAGARVTLLRKAELNEMSWGTHEGKPFSQESAELYNQVKAGWERGEIDQRIGGGESAREMGERLSRFLVTLRAMPQQNILICSHGRAICGLVTLMMGEPIGEMYKHQHSNTGLWLAEEREQDYHFLLRNDTSHLATLTNSTKHA